jgi:hypothetical protein
VYYVCLILFIYVYYKLFVCINLVDVISLFFTIFSFHLPVFDKNRSIYDKNCPKILANLLMFPVFTVPPSSPVHLTDFH